MWSLTMAAPMRVQVAVVPSLLQELLVAIVAEDPGLVVVDRLIEAEVLVTAAGDGPLHVSRVVETVCVVRPSDLIATILASGPSG